MTYQILDDELVTRGELNELLKISVYKFYRLRELEIIPQPAHGRGVRRYYNGKQVKEIIERVGIGGTKVRLV